MPVAYGISAIAGAVFGLARGVWYGWPVSSVIASIVLNATLFSIGTAAGLYATRDEQDD